MGKSGKIIIAILILALFGFRMYLNHEREQQNKATQKINQEIYLEVQKQQRAIEYKAQQDAAQKQRDSIFDIQKKEQDAQIQQIREAVKKLKEQEKK